MGIERNYLVFTDLDATLLNHDTYSWEAAEQALRALKEKKCPLILNSSKTLSEMKGIAEALQTHASLVCENGALVAVPESSKELILPRGHDEIIDGYKIYYLGSSREETLKIINEMRVNSADFTFAGYQDWSVKEVSKHTQLPMEEARKSKDRLGTEPIHWHGTEEAFQRFIDALSEHSLSAVLGGRFIHLSGDFTKASGVRWLQSVYEKSFSETEWTTVALGDSPNDTAMLSAAHIGVVIPNHTKIFPTSKQVYYAEEHGPEGWNTEIIKLLAELE